MVTNLTPEERESRDEYIFESLRRLEKTKQELAEELTISYSMVQNIYTRLCKKYGASKVDSRRIHAKDVDTSEGN